MSKMQEKEFIELVKAHVTDEGIKINLYVNYSGFQKGYVVTAQSELMKAVHLSSARKEFRTFATLDSAAKFLKGIGVNGFTCFVMKPAQE